MRRGRGRATNSKSLKIASGRKYRISSNHTIVREKFANKQECTTESVASHYCGSTQSYSCKKKKCKMVESIQKCTGNPLDVDSYTEGRRENLLEITHDSLRQMSHREFYLKMSETWSAPRMILFSDATFIAQAQHPCCICS